MPDKKLGIELVAKERISQAVGKVGRAVRTATSAFRDLGTRGAAAVSGLTQKIFFMREALRTVASVVRGLFDAFIKPAIAARKLEVSLINVFGEAGLSQKIRAFSRETGLSFESVAKGALDMGDAIKTKVVGGLDSYLNALRRVSQYRPDLTVDQVLGMVNSVIDKAQEATEGTEKQLGRYTSVVIGGVGAQMVDLNAELDKLGVVAKVVDTNVTALDRLREAWEHFKATVGAKILDKLIEGVIKLLGWLEKNEDKVLRLVDAFTDLINKGIQKLIDWIDGGGLDRLLEQFQEWAEIIKGIAGDLAPIIGRISRGEQPQGFGEAVAGTIARPGTAFGRAAGTMRLAAATGAAGLGLGVQRTFGWAGVGRGRNLAAEWGGRMLGVPTARERQQQVQVTVGIDPRGGNVTGFVNNQLGRNNDDLDRALGGRSMSTFGAWAQP